MSYKLAPMEGDRDWSWIRARVPIKQVEDTKGIIAHDGVNICAAVVFDNFTYSSVQVHQVVEKPMAIRHLFPAVARYVYDTCGLYQMIGLVPAEDESVLKHNLKIGFEEVARIPHGHSIGQDMVVMTMTSIQCRFYEPEKAA